MRRIPSLTTLAMAAALAAAVALLGGAEADAQEAVGVNPGRDCQIVKACNFARNGAVRGCLSAYTCRTCRLVKARCSIAGRTKCQELVCSWGG